MVGFCDSYDLPSVPALPILVTVLSNLISCSEKHSIKIYALELWFSLSRTEVKSSSDNGSCFDMENFYLGTHTICNGFFLANFLNLFGNH